MELPNRAINAVTSVVPSAMAISLVKKEITGKSAGVGEISMEFELLDSQTSKPEISLLSYLTPNGGECH